MANVLRQPMSGRSGGGWKNARRNGRGASFGSGGGRFPGRGLMRMFIGILILMRRSLLCRLLDLFLNIMILLLVLTAAVIKNSVTRMILTVPVTRGCRRQYPTPLMEMVLVMRVLTDTQPCAPEPVGARLCQPKELVLALTSGVRTLGKAWASSPRISPGNHRLSGARTTATSPTTTTTTTTLTSTMTKTNRKNRPYLLHRRRRQRQRRRRRRRTRTPLHHHHQPPALSHPPTQSSSQATTKARDVSNHPPKQQQQGRSSGRFCWHQSTPVQRRLSPTLPPRMSFPSGNPSGTAWRGRSRPFSLCSWASILIRGILIGMDGDHPDAADVVDRVCAPVSLLPCLGS